MMIDISNLKINFHLFEKCNMCCQFCYRDKSKNVDIQTFEVYKKIIDRLHEIGFKQINFAGGEPTLFSDLIKLLEYSYKLGFTNSIISNGYIEDKNNLEKFVNEILKYVDVYGISVDSLDENINLNIGRYFIFKKEFVSLNDIYRIYTCVKNNNKKFKINTVVSCFNKNDESLLKIFEKGIIVDRWKILRVHKSPNIIKSFFVDDNEYFNFVQRIKNKCSNICEENKDDMVNSYLMIDGNGNLSVDSTNKIFKKINIFESSNLDIINFINDNLDEQKYLKRYK